MFPIGKFSFKAHETTLNGKFCIRYTKEKKNYKMEPNAYKKWQIGVWSTVSIFYVRFSFLSY